MRNITHMLELMDRPAFCAENGRIIAANRSALARQIGPEQNVEELLLTGLEEYRSFTEGFLSLKLLCCGERYDASVTVVDGRQIFVLEPDNAESELRILALAAQTLREPLGDVMSLMEELDADPEKVAQIERGLYRLLRIVGNMSPQSAFHPEMQDVGAVLYELWEKAEPVCRSKGVELQFRGPGKPVYSCVDTQLLTRAIHNLLSNSLKFAADGGTIRMELSSGPRFYRITIRDQGHTPWPGSDPFTRYRREPGLGDGRSGLGLGLKLVQLAASVHGGTVWLLSPPEGGLQVTLTLPLKQDAAARSPRLRISYSGERDPMLIELSDVLPAEFYK